MNKFTLGAVTGMSSLAIAVPLLATVSFAQSAPSASTDEARRAVPTQACLTARVDLETAHLANIDANIDEQKARMQERIDALKGVAAIADEDERAQALQQMHEGMRDQKIEIEAPENVKAAMEAVKSACGDVFMMHKGIGFPGMGARAMKVMRFGGGDGPVRLEKFDFEAGAPVELEDGETVTAE